MSWVIRHPAGVPRIACWYGNPHPYIGNWVQEFIYMDTVKKKKKKSQWFSGVIGRKDEKAKHRGFLAVKLLCLILLPWPPLSSMPPALKIQHILWEEMEKDELAVEEHFTGKIQDVWEHSCYQLVTPQSHLTEPLDEIRGHWSSQSLSTLIILCLYW